MHVCWGGGCKYVYFLILASYQGYIARRAALSARSPHVVFRNGKKKNRIPPLVLRRGALHSYHRQPVNRGQAGVGVIRGAKTETV